MYTTVTDIDRKIAELKVNHQNIIAHSFAMGEIDRNAHIPPRYPDDKWYMSGYSDRDYQIKIGFNLIVLKKYQYFMHPSLKPISLAKINVTH